MNMAESHLDPSKLATGPAGFGAAAGSVRSRR